eukprot:scaffold286984_cov20-Prasinocladus_malaysianus.AAC.1
MTIAVYLLRSGQSLERPIARLAKAIQDILACINRSFRSPARFINLARTEHHCPIFAQMMTTMPNALALPSTLGSNWIYYLYTVYAYQKRASISGS